MSLVSSMYSAANGITAHSDAMSTVSDNIANVNTVGFKETRANFADVVAQSPAAVTRSNSAGQGSFINNIDESFSQGALLSTGGNLDLALQGDGFFIVNGSYDAIDGNFYSRAGQFHIDAQGVLVNDSEMHLQGYTADATGKMQPVVGDIHLQATTQAPPQITQNCTATLNLDETATVPPAFDATAPGNTSNYANSLTVFDSRGDSHNIDVFFRNAGGNTWEWHALAQGGEIAGGTAGTATEIGTGTMAFNTNGELTTVTGDTATASFVNATPGQVMTFNFGDPTSTGGTGLLGITSYAGSSSLDRITQDGYPEGQLAGVGIDNAGLINGTFSNGHKRVLGQLAVARFTNNGGLARAGGTMWTSTLDSGDASVGPAGSGGQASIITGSLEQSNVNLSQQFINLLTYQRGFQANTRTVTASDEMLQGLVNLGR